MASDIKGKISQINGKPLVDVGLRNDIGDLSLVDGTLVEFVNSKPSLSQVRDEIGKVIGDAPEAFDTLKEISDWISEHGTDFTDLSEKVNTKLDKVTSTGTSNRVYAIASNGSQYIAKLTNSVVSGEHTIPLRDTNGNFKVGTPKADGDVTNKGYVDSKLSEVSPYRETTYSILKALRDESKLIKGSTYRITDYITVVSDDGSDSVRSAGHQFDILVMADSENKLNEDAKAIQHSGDTYFSKSRLEAWKIKYCLDNDNIRFNWANTTNGKGVIYEMIDEFNNDLPYDFKNIQFKRYELDNVQYKFDQGEDFSIIPVANISDSNSWYTKNITFSFPSDNDYFLRPTYLADAPSQFFYTFSLIKIPGGEAIDATLGVIISDNLVGGAPSFSNKIEKFIFLIKENVATQILNNIVFINITSESFACYNNILSGSILNSTIDAFNCCNNTIKSEFYDNIILGDFSKNTIEPTANDNFLSISDCIVNNSFVGNYGKYKKNIIETNVRGNIACQENGDFAVISNSIIKMATQYNKTKDISGSTIDSSFCKFNQKIVGCILNTQNNTYDSVLSSKVVSNYDVDGKITSNEYLVKSKSTELTEMNLVPKYYMDTKIQELENKIAELTAKIPNITVEDVGK